MTYQDALTRYIKWVNYFPGDNQPNESLSEEHDGIWHLHNVNGPLAVVMSNGEVIAIGNFWAAYERLADDGKCDSPGGAEYRRVLAEWIEQQPDDMEKFICRRARGELATVSFVYADKNSSVTCTITATVEARDEEEAIEEALEEVQQAVPQLYEVIENCEPDKVVWNPLMLKTITPDAQKPMTKRNDALNDLIVDQWMDENGILSWHECLGSPVSEIADFEVVKWHTHDFTLKQIAEGLSDWDNVLSHDKWFVCRGTVFLAADAAVKFGSDRPAPRLICDLEYLGGVHLDSDYEQGRRLVKQGCSHIGHHVIGEPEVPDDAGYCRNCSKPIDPDEDESGLCDDCEETEHFLDNDWDEDFDGDETLDSEGQSE